MQKARIKTMCAVHKGIFEIGDDDRVFVDLGNKTVTVCLPCQNKIRNYEVCEICKKPRAKQSVRSIKLVGSKKFRRICIWCMKRFNKKEVPDKLIKKIFREYPKRGE